MGEEFGLRKEDAEIPNEDVYSKVVRAGKRTYFFDVKATRNDDYYLTITESRKKTGKDGEAVFEKNKIYLYKEDFAKFGEGFEHVVQFIRKSKPAFSELAPERAESVALDMAEDH